MSIARSVETISPELALVDHELDSSARRALPDASDCLKPAVYLARVDPPTLRRGLPTRRVAGVALVLVAAAIGFVAAGHDADRRASGAATHETATRAASLDPDGRAAVRVPASRRAAASASSRPRSAHADSAVRMRWRPVPDAVFYNVILWRGSSRVRDLWPRRPSVEVRRRSLAPGTYRWFVYPALGNGSNRRYGALVAQGVVKV